MWKCSIDSEVLPTYQVRVYRTKKLKLGQTGKCFGMKRLYMFLVKGLFSCGSVAMDTGQKCSLSLVGGAVSWELLDANGKGEEPFCKDLPDSVTSGTYPSFGTGTKLRVIPSESGVCIILLSRVVSEMVAFGAHDGINRPSLSGSFSGDLSKGINRIPSSVS